MTSVVSVRGSRTHRWLLVLPFVWQVGLVPVVNDVSFAIARGEVADDALSMIARAADGSMRDAQSAFDQVISFAGDKIKMKMSRRPWGLPAPMSWPGW